MTLSVSRHVLVMALATAVLGVGVGLRDAGADTLVLRGGARIEGELLSYDQKSQEFRFRLSDGGVLTLRRADVATVTVSGPPGVALPPSPSDAPAGPTGLSETLERQPGPPPVPSAAAIRPVWVPVPERRPLNGTEVISSPGATGLGTLTIVNEMDGDALVKLFDPATRQVSRAVYVRAGGRTTLPAVTPKTYRLRFTVGDEWDSPAREFRRGARYSEFSRWLVFTETGMETATGTETRYVTITVTLHRVPGGTRPVTDIDRARFREGDPR